MAKVALITEFLTPLALNLASALEQQRQEVVLITSKSEKEKAPTHLTAIFPFQKWSATEAAKILPKLMTENFDVWHFLFATPESKPRMAHWCLAVVAKTLPNKVVASTFSSQQNVASFKNEKFISLVDLALFPNRSFLMKMKRRKTFGSHALAEVLPPLDWQDDNKTQTFRDETLRLIKNLRPFILTPELKIGPEWIDHSPLDFVIPKAAPKKGSQHPHVFYTGELFPNEREALLKRAKALCLLYGDYSVLELQKFHQWSEQYQLPLIVLRHQTELYPGLCWNEKSGWILEDGAAGGLKSLLVRNPKLELKSEFQNYPHRELMDSTLNELLRLYQRAFMRRWT